MHAQAEDDVKIREKMAIYKARREVCIRFLQRNRTNKRFYVYDTCELYYKELAHVIIEAGKWHNLLFARGKIRKVDGINSSLSLETEYPAVLLAEVPV